MAKSNDKMVANNKKAYHDYFILDKIETGIALHGTEVKSLRMGKCISVHMKREISLIKTHSESENYSFINQRSIN